MFAEGESHSQARRSTGSFFRRPTLPDSQLTACQWPKRRAAYGQPDSARFTGGFGSRRAARNTEACEVAHARAALAVGAVAGVSSATVPSIVPLPAPTPSTVPGNGDVNPYGVVFVPRSVQGRGSTIVQIQKDGTQTVFFTARDAGNDCRTECNFELTRLS